jgi:hypothetical protein
MINFLTVQYLIIIYFLDKLQKQYQSEADLWYYLHTQ